MKSELEVEGKIKHRDFQKIIKRTAADQRAKARAERSSRQQLQRLIDRGAGHCKEALRLQRELDNKPKKAKKVTQ